MKEVPRDKFIVVNFHKSKTEWKKKWYKFALEAHRKRRARHTQNNREISHSRWYIISYNSTEMKTDISAFMYNL